MPVVGEAAFGLVELAGAFRPNLRSAAVDQAKDHVMQEVRKLLTAISMTPSEPRRTGAVDVEGQLAELLLMSRGEAPIRARVWLRGQDLNL